MLGSNFKTRSYRILLPNSNKVIDTKHVKFDKDYNLKSIRDLIWILQTQIHSSNTHQQKNMNKLNPEKLKSPYQNSMSKMNLNQDRVKRKMTDSIQYVKCTRRLATSMLWLSQNFFLYQTIITENRKFSKGHYFFLICINIEENRFLQEEQTILISTK